MSRSGTVAEVSLLIQDAGLQVEHGIRGGAIRETKLLELPDGANDRFLDGPACRRVAVVDFDPATSAPLPAPARFVLPQNPGTTRGSFPIGEDPLSPATLAVNAFGIVFQTIKMFEGKDALGRQVDWAFGGEQLLIVPRAGEWANAFYERATRSLQFFWFPGDSGSTVYTALSRDIVAHETAHALLDAVVPSLYDSATPESIAIHESVADMVAVLMALDSDELRTSVLARSGNDLSEANAFSRIAEEFGTSRLGPGGVRRTELRELANDATRASLATAPPHLLSTLLSAILYDSLAHIFDARFHSELDRLRDDGERQTPAQAANRALGTAHLIFRRLLLRAIDYLPPGELSFADVGRATLAADRAALPDADADDEIRRRRQDFAQRFVDRGLLPERDALNGRVPGELDVPAAQLPGLRDSDYLAYEYVGRHRGTIGIPDGIPFTVLPRVDATKRVGRKDTPPQRELILKVGWSHVEPARMPNGTSKDRLVPTGATVSFAWGTGECLALVVSDIASRQHQHARDQLLVQLESDGLLDESASGPAERLGVDDSGAFVTLSRTHRLLHLEGWDD
ncbi:hypothetical protein ACFFGH_32700 [Lysobacter korlensis]|uniref:Peptidase M4 domain-containing protein n=1 Tax=Lysobacter korlensis TaxID=553636 RepID=A0ABV6S1A3_9GAMM